MRRFIPSLVGTPSTMYNGSLLFNVPIPLNLTVVPAPLGEPSPVTIIPATLPCKDCIAFELLTFFKSLISTIVTEPVKSAFFCVEYPVTTTSSISLVSEDNVTLIMVLAPTFCSVFCIPIIENTNTASELGTVKVYLPSIFVIVPVVVPFTITFTPTKVSPSSADFTTPDIDFV